MSEASSTIENEPPVAPVITTRAKVVRESFTALRSDFEVNATPPIARPQRQDAIPVTRSGGQANIALSVGGGIFLVGGIFAFLFFGYGSNKSGSTGAKPAASAGAASAAVNAGAATARLPRAPGHGPTESHAETGHKKVVAKPVQEHRAVAVAPKKDADTSPAHSVAFTRPRELRDLPRESHPTTREKPVAVSTPKPASPVASNSHHAEGATHGSSPASGGHSLKGAELDPAHLLGN